MAHKQQSAASEVSDENIKASLVLLDQDKAPKCVRKSIKREKSSIVKIPKINVNKITFNQKPKKNE